MKTQPTIPSFSTLLETVPLALIIAMASSAHADPTFWTGANTNFDQANAAADVLVPGAVSLSRAGNHWLYNTNVDLNSLFNPGQPGPNLGTPSDTEWAFGNIENALSLPYQTFDSFRNGDLSGVLVPLGIPPGPSMVVHLINEDIYLSLAFTRWPHGGGFFAYTRSTPAAVVPPPAPTVTITNPASGAVFAAQANVTIAADAAVSGGGTVTNVSFFFLGAGTPIGSRQSPPFSIVASNLVASSYSLKAVATAAGISGTSSVVSISVVNPVATSLLGPAAANNQFSFNYSANVGLRYVVENSSNLFNWKPLVTNTAAANPVFFTNGISLGNSFYRVGRLPNP